jgi:hypothetical protein
VALHEILLPESYLTIKSRKKGASRAPFMVTAGSNQPL